MTVRRRPMPPPLARKVDRLFARWNKPASPGCALAVIREGRYLHTRCYGLANLDDKVPITTSTAFDIGSVTKQFTATCVCILVQRGKLSLDDEIHQYLPELPPYDHPVTVRHLLQHTGGIRGSTAVIDLMGHFPGRWPSDAPYRVLCRMKGLDFRPGEKWSYSNTGYMLLRMIVEKVSGTSMRKFAHEAVFKTLGMKCTHYRDDPDELEPGRARGYSVRKEGGFRIDEYQFVEPGPGFLSSTLEDMILWDRASRRDRIGKPGLVAMMEERGKLNNGSEMGYGFGLNIMEHRGARAIGHGGAVAGYRSTYLRFPEHGFAVILLMNMDAQGPWEAAHEVAGICLEDVLKPKPRTLKPPKAISIHPERLERFAGNYRANDGGTLRVLLSGTSLKLGGNWEGLVDLAPVAESEFLLSGHGPEERVLFAEKDNGPLSLRWINGGKVIWELDRLSGLASAPASVKPNPGAYAGYYYNEEGEITMEVTVQDGSLQCRGMGQLTLPRTGIHIEGDRFQVGNFIFVFSRREDGVVNGFELQVGDFRMEWKKVHKPG